MARDDQYLDDVEDGQDEASDGLGTGLVAITTLIMVVGFIIVELALKEYGRGLFAG